MVRRATRDAARLTRAAAAVGVAAAIGLAGACSGERSPARDTAAATGTRAPESARAAAAAESVAAVRDEWNLAEVVKRITQAGLVVQASGDSARQPYLHVRGEKLGVSGSELQVYLYASAAARRADSDLLDSTTVAPPQVVTHWIVRPRLIVSGNLLAIHLTENEHLAERVSDVLTARHTGGGR